MLENYVENFLNGQGNVNDLVKEYKKQIEQIEKYKKSLSIGSTIFDVLF